MSELNPWNLPNFEWGTDDRLFINNVGYENMDWKVYEKYKEVQQNDLVIDVGASSGIFTYSIIKKNPKQVYCIEASDKMYQTLIKNMQMHNNVVCVNKAIQQNACSGDILAYWDSKTKPIETLSFKTFLDEHSITHINFLKSDCEGGEYSIFNEENIEWLNNHVDYFAAEFHFVNRNSSRNYQFLEFYHKVMPKLNCWAVENATYYTHYPQEYQAGYNLKPRFNDVNYICHNFDEIMIYGGRIFEGLTTN